MSKFSWLRRKPTPPTTPTPPVVTPPPATPTTKTVVFSAPFSDAANWVVGRTSSYPAGNPQTNPGDNKLDSLRTGTFTGNRFYGTKGPGSKWTTDLVTTEGSAQGFKVKTGDELTATVTLFNQLGAWPAIWTWGAGSLPGHGEVDLFEYHPDNPRLLELTDHVHSGNGYGSYANNAINPGVPFVLGTKFLSTGVVWTVNGTVLYTAPVGLPANFSASLIVNMSICAGQYHPAPPVNDTTARYFDVSNLQVVR